MAALLPRRAFLLGAGGLGLATWPTAPWASEASEPPTTLPTTEADLAATEGGRAAARVRGRAVPWRFAAYNPNTRETLNVIYRVGDVYSPTAMRWISVFMRDWRLNRARLMDPRLIDLIAYIHAASGSSEPILLLSGYRTPQTNAALRARGADAATDSLHLEGMAADLRIQGVSTRWIRDAALYLRLGGVGYYPNADFAHLDTGPVRRWGA
jgi:uncharacterized protein YcbK (DUF882 family)